MATIPNGFRRHAALLYPAIAGSLLLASCSSEQVVDEPSVLPLRFMLDVGLEGYQSSGTRSDALEWKNGDRIYFALHGDEKDVLVRAVYDAGQSEWKMSYDGIFPSGVYTGTGVFIDGETREWNDGLTLGPDVAVYRDGSVKCEKTNTYLKVTALLRPMLGRLRFSNPTPCSFTLSGIVHYSRMRLTDLGFETLETPVQCTIGDDRFSSYLYGSMPATSRAISVAYDNQLYTATFKDRILDAGKSGYIDVPTESAHSGWDLIILSIPELGALDAIDIGANSITVSSMIVGNGNGTVTDCGFCYSLSPAPTLNDAKLSCGRPLADSFTKTITGLEENTPYHIRAYAVNESGIAYSEEKTVATLAIGLPILSATTVKVEDGTTEATFSAQIVSESNGKVTECGFCYSTTPMPDITANRIQCKVSPTFGYEIRSLKIGTRYYVRAYAINSKGVAYGEQTFFIGGGGKPSDDDLPRPNMVRNKQ